MKLAHRARIAFALVAIAVSVVHFSLLFKPDIGETDYPKATLFPVYLAIFVFFAVHARTHALADQILRIRPGVIWTSIVLYAIAAFSVYAYHLGLAADPATYVGYNALSCAISVIYVFIIMICLCGSEFLGIVGRILKFGRERD